jgi:hypothetical protein
MAFARMSRRLFLKSTGIAAVGVVTIGSSIVMAPNAAWAVSLSKLDARSGKTLIRLARDLYPHSTIDDGPYAKVVEGLDQEAAKDGKVADMLSSGAQALDKAAGGDYADAADDKRMAALNGMAGDPVVQKVRGAMINGFYNDPTVWKAFGYEGSSAEFGGYLHRGFNDVNWLPSS